MISINNIPQLYYRYKKTHDVLLRKYIVEIEVFNKDFNPLDISASIENPRGRSLTFDTTTINRTVDKSEYIPFKNITYLVKSSSRFFLKPDIGEIFDQIDRDDLHKLKAIQILENYLPLEGTEGEHFLMEAILYRSR